MVTIYFVNYADFKTQVPLLLGTGAAVRTLVRDGTPINTGFEVMSMELTEQLALKFGAMSKPPTFDTDFPKRVYVT